MRDLVTVFGGSGFIGSQVVRALAKKGLRIRIAVRQPHLAGAQRLHGDVGQIEIVQANVRDSASVRRALEGASACVNLVGILYEHGRQRFEAVHAQGATIVAQAARDAGVSRFVQMSALGADPASPSAYARSKAAAEAAVRGIIPTATILRPSIVFGAEDDFFNRFAAMAVVAPALPLIGGGQTRFQPVYVGDVAQAVVAGITDPATAGRTFELGGPAVFTFRELMQIVLDETGRRRALVPLPAPLASAVGAVAQLASGLFAPPVTPDQVRLLARDNVVSQGADGLEALGIAPTALEGVVGTYLYRYRKGGQYADQTGLQTV